MILRKIFLAFSFLYFFTSCSVNKAQIDNDLKVYFDSKKVEGGFTMLNNASGEITVYNMEMDTMRLAPGSTFDILHSLIALETGVLTDEKMVVKWDGISRANPDWNRDMTVTDAFKSNAVPFFQNVARSIGKDTMQEWIDSISYGNRKMSGAIDSFWMKNILKISPDEQLGLLKRLYFDQLPFRKSVQQVVRDMMVKEDNSNFKLCYKSAEGMDEMNHPFAWTIGWIEENRHVYFFSTIIKTNDEKNDVALNSINITKDILQHYDFFKGKK
jgi:beta-lactamase class D